LFALLAKGPTLEEEDRLAELADKLYNVYCEVWELQGFRKTAMFIGIVHGKIAAQIRARVSSVNSGLQREDRRRGDLTSSQGKRTSLDLMGKRVASILQGLAKAGVRELGYIERATTSIRSLARHQPPDLPDSIETMLGGNIQRPSGADVANRVSGERQRCLGRWAEERLPEFRLFVRLVRAGESPPNLRQRFPVLFAEVIDCLPQKRQDRLFNEARGGLMRVPDLMSALAEVKHLSASTLMDYRKQYRHETGTARPRPIVPKSKNKE
jgi:hypothetical protein